MIVYIVKSIDGETEGVFDTRQKAQKWRHNLAKQNNMLYTDWDIEERVLH